MSNSIESAITSLLSDNNTVKKLETLLKSNNDNENTKPNNEKSKQFQQKIDILKTIEPMISEKNREHISFIIKVLNIAKLLSEIS